MAIFLLIWLALGTGVAYLADSRGRSGIGFFLLSIFLSPLLGLIVVLVTEDKNVTAERDRQRRRDHERQLESIRAIAASAQPASKPSPRVVAAPTPAASVADELIKLAALRDKGILTEAEFQEQKQAILGTIAATAIGPQPLP